MYRKVAYYCNYCDETFILEKYKSVIDVKQHDGEFAWLCAKNVTEQNLKTHFHLNANELFWQQCGGESLRIYRTSGAKSVLKINIICNTDLYH